MLWRICFTFIIYNNIMIKDYLSVQCYGKRRQGNKQSIFA